MSGPVGLDEASPVMKRPKVSLTDNVFVGRILGSSEEDALNLCVEAYNRLVQGSAALDRSFYLGLVFVAKVRSELFARKEMTAVLVQTLKGQDGAKDMLVPLLACNLLQKGYQSMPEWPPVFVQCFLIDSFGARNWVDHELAAPFVSSICTAFEETVTPTSRFKDAQAREKIRAASLSELRRHVERKENVRGLVKAIASLCTYDECRLLAARRLVQQNGGWLLDVNLARHTRDLFEVLCSRVALDSVHDVEAMRVILSVPIGTLPQSFVWEQHVRMLSNNAQYPLLALQWALLPSSNNGDQQQQQQQPDVARAALAAFPNEQVRARQSGQMLFQMCTNASVTKQIAVDVAQKLMSVYPKLLRPDLCIGLLQAPIEPDALPKIEAVFRLVLSWQQQGDMTQAVRIAIADIFSVVAQWCRRVGASSSVMQSMLFVAPQDQAGIFSLIPCNDSVLDPVSMGMGPDFLPIVYSLLIRAAKTILKLSPPFAVELIDRIERVSTDWPAIVCISIIGVFCPPAAPRAINLVNVRRLLTMLVTRRFASDVPTQVVATLQSIPNLPQIVWKSREPDYVAMALQHDPETIQSAPLWLPQILASGDASFLQALPSGAAVRTLLVAFHAGPSSPLFPHTGVLASRLNIADPLVSTPLIEGLTNNRAALRASASAALGVCQGEFTAADTLILVKGMFIVETDAKRIIVALQRCCRDVNPSEMTHAIVKAIENRPAFRKVIRSDIGLQVMLMRIFVSNGGGASVEGLNVVLSYFPPEQHMHADVQVLRKQLRVATHVVSFSTPSALQRDQKSAPAFWWLNDNNSVQEDVKLEVKKVVSAKHPVAQSTWEKSVGAESDIQNAHNAQRVHLDTSSKIHIAGSPARNAVLCILGNGPLSPIACKLLLKYHPDAGSADALLQYAVSNKPVHFDALLVALPFASKTALAFVMDGLMSLPIGQNYAGQIKALLRQVVRHKHLLNWAMENAFELRKVLATRGGFSWDDADEYVASLCFMKVPDVDQVVFDASAALMSEDAALRQDAYARLAEVLSQASPALAELTVNQWRYATQNKDSDVVRDAIHAAVMLHVVLGPSAGIRDWLLKTHGPRAAADLFRALLVLKGIC